MLKVSLIVTFGALLAIASAQLDMSNDKMKFEDNIAEESSHSDETVFATKPILNDGKPFFVARDPSTGNLDFNQKKTAGIQNDIPVESKDQLTSHTKSGDIGSLGKDFFHDKLNLPVKYSSSKFVYPLISGSYANMKYQGNNKVDSNHKNYTSTLGTTSPPKYFTHIRDHTFTATFKHPTTALKTTTTTEAPVKTVSEIKTSTISRTFPTTTPIPVTTEAPKATTIKYSSTIIQQNQFPSTFKNYVDSSETRKKTTLKIVESSTTRAPSRNSSPANPVKFVDEDDDLRYTRPTTYRPPLSYETRLSFSTSMPLMKPSAFRPVSTEAPPKNHSQKIVFESGSKNPSIMSLSDIFNSISGNDQNSISYDSIDSDSSDQIEIKTLPPSTSSSSSSSISAATTPSTAQKTLQQIKNSQNQQFVDLPVFKPQDSSSSNIGFPSDESSAFDDYVEFENPSDAKYANQYVKYEVQKPNTNLVAFKQIPSMNNVVISPGQNSASFVLGSQQSVGSVGVGSSMGVGTNEFVSNNNNNNGPMKVGQVINDEPPVRSNQMQASIRFPNDAQNGYNNAQIVKGTIKHEGSQAEVVQPPQALSQNKPAQKKPLVFPPPNANPNSINAELSVRNPTQVNDPTKVIFENVNDIYEKINDKKQRQEMLTTKMSENIAPDELKPPSADPPPSTQYPFNNNRQQQPPPQFNNFRRPVNGQRPPHPPVIHQQLPNILPQFRPNSKSSHGHPPVFKELGSIRVPPNQQQFMRHPYPAPKVGLPSLMSPPPSTMMSSPPTNYRRGPPPTRRVTPNRINGPNQYPPQESANRRIYRPQQPSQNHNDLTYMKPPPFAHPGFQLKRILTGNPETLQMIQRPSNIPPQAAKILSHGPTHDGELNKSLPPAPSTMLTSVEEESNGTSLEPVITLQMLQSKKTPGGKLNLPPVPHDIPQDLHSAHQAPSTLPSNHKEEPAKKPSVYVVYPVQSQSFENPQPLRDDEQSKEPSIIPEYQNTPFSVVSHFEQEPLLMKKDKKKQSFPYYLEKPAQQIEMKSDRPADYHHVDGSIYNIGEQPTILKHPDAISSKLMRATEKPIAIAYTPTEPSRVYTPTSYYRPNNQYSHYYDPYLSGDKFSNPNFGSPVISEIFDDKRVAMDYYNRQQQIHRQDLSSSQQEHYDFQAPFQASVSLNPEVTNPYEGWAVVTQATDSNKIDRSDSLLIDDEQTTKKFDLNDFQPAFESGFKPIYSERRVSTAPEIHSESDELFGDSDESTEIFHSAKLVDPSTSTTTVKTATSSPVPSTTFSSVETSSEASKSTSFEETTTIKVEKQKKKIEIDSLEAFFESLTRDYDDDDESTNKSENESRSL